MAFIVAKYQWIVSIRRGIHSFTRHGCCLLLISCLQFANSRPPSFLPSVRTYVSPWHFICEWEQEQKWINNIKYRITMHATPFWIQNCKKTQNSIRLFTVAWSVGDAVWVWSRVVGGSHLVRSLTVCIVKDKGCAVDSSRKRLCHTAVSDYKQQILIGHMVFLYLSICPVCPAPNIPLSICPLQQRGS